MDYDQLRKYLRKEKNTAKLVQVKDGFYEKLKELMKEKHQEYEETMSPKIKKDLENIKKIAKDIYRKRERKILSRALKYAEKNPEEYNLTRKEREIYQNLRKTIKKGREDLENILEGKKTSDEEEMNIKQPSKKEEKEKTRKKKTQDEDLNKVMVKILKEVPEFVSDNLQKLGPYKPDTKIKIPKEQAKILSKKGLAKKIEKTEGDQDEDT